MLKIELIHKQTAKLLSNPLLINKPIVDIAQLRIFMEHHVFAVWDFMCLAKSLQHSIAPSCSIWLPPDNQLGARLINEIITVEETDRTFDGNSYCSHFELYLQAMSEVGADTHPIKNFIKTIKSHNIKTALKLPSIPNPARNFVETTISLISKDKPWVTCSAFLFGRESLIPEMFQELIANKIVNPKNCPAFEYYLNRHIEVDGGNDDEFGHSTMGKLLLDTLCENNSIRFEEAENTAIESLQARDILWHNVYSLVKPRDLKCA
jgi:hypothetical protein